MLRRAQYIGIVGIVHLLASVAFAQWEQLASFNSQIVSIHFQSEDNRPQVGFVGTATGEVWRTTDQGITWTRTVTPSFLNGRVTSFTFRDSMMGWFSAMEESNVSCLYKTTNGGSNWTADTLYGLGTSVTYNRPYGNLILTTWSGYNFVSSNDGARWFSLGISESMCGVTFSTPRFGVMTGTLSQPIATSGDGGRTWRKAQVLQEMWNPHGIKGTNIVIGVAEITHQVLLSGNSGGDWDYIAPQFQQNDLTGYIGGTANALFLQAKDGVYVSRNTGQSWKHYCGPGNDYDTRMFVTGDTVYAGSVDGKLYVNYYGVSHYKDFLEFSRTQYDFLSPGCYRMDSAIHLTNISTCEKVKITDISIIPQGSSTFGFFQQTLPKTLGSSDSIRIYYTPDDLKPDSAELRITYAVGDSQYTQRIKLKGNGKQGLNVGFSKELSILLASDCAKLDTFITIKNGPCDSVLLISAVVSDPATFTISNPTLPLSIGPNGSINIGLGVNTVTPGDYTASVLVRLSNGTTFLDTLITIKLKVLSARDPLVTFSKPSVKFDSVSTCDIRFDTLRITNTICKQVTIENISIAPTGPALTVIYQPSGVRFLKPNETDSIIVAYAPSDETPLVATISIRTAFDPATTRDTQIAITGFGKAFGDAVLSTTSLTFSSMNECEETDVESWLVNLSCDSAEIVGLELPTDAGFQIVEPTLPMDIAPDDSVRVRIHVGPISSGSKFDSVSIRIRTRSGVERELKLTLLGTVKSTQRLLTLSDTLKLDSLPPCTTIDTVITLVNHGICDTLVIDTVMLAGASWFGVDPILLPITLIPNDSIQVRLQFRPPVNGQSGGDLRFIGNGLDTSVVLQIGTGPYVDPMPMSLTDSLFTAFLCKNARQHIRLSNPFCDTLVIDNISLTGNGTQFTFTSGLTLPLLIMPGKDTLLEIEFNPNAPGDSTALLMIGSGENSITKTVSLLGSYRNTKGVAGIDATIGNGAKQLLIGQDDFFVVNIVANNFIEKARDLTTIECSFRFNDNVLTYENSAYLWGGLGSFQRDSGFLRFVLNTATTNDIQPGQVLATVTFSTTIGDSTYSPIDFIARLNPSDSLYHLCVLEPLAADPIRVDIDDTCGDAIIRKWINRRLDIFDNFSIVPNPTSDLREVKVTFDLLHQQDVTLSIYDANGKKLTDKNYPELRKGKHEMHLDLPQVSEGWCFVMVESPGQRDVKKLVLRK